MDPTTTIVTLYAVIWVGTYVAGRVLKAERFGFVFSPLYFMYKTTALNEWMSRLAEKRKALWSTLGNVGIAVGVGLMIYAIYLLGSNLFNLFFHVEAATSIQPVIPLPGLTVSWESFPYIVIAISLVAITHELAHGVAARVNNVALKSAGVFIAVVLFAAFVEIEEEQLDKASNETKMRVYAAGSFSNAALGLVVLLLFANFAATITPFYTTNYSGVEVAGLIPGYPAERAGLQPGDVITGVNGVPVHGVTELQRAMAGVPPGTQVTISTSRGRIPIVTEADPQNSSRAIIGVSPIRDLITYTARLPLLPDNLPYHLLRVEFWISIVFVSVAVINMLPLYVFDGGRFLESLLNALGIGRTKEIRMFATAASLAVLGLNFAMSVLRFGFIKL